MATPPPPPVINYISEKAKIGNNVQIWHFTFVGENTEIGDNVRIGSLVHLDSNVTIGENTSIQGNAHISRLSRIGKNVFIGPSVTFTNDPYPPSKRLVGITIGDNVVLGARSVIQAGVTIGKNSVVAMGATVTRDVPEDSVVMGTPATIRYSREEYDKKQDLWNRG